MVGATTGRASLCGVILLCSWPRHWVRAGVRDWVGRGGRGRKGRRVRGGGGGRD